MFLCIGGQPGPHSNFQESHGYIESKPLVKQTKKNQRLFQSQGPSPQYLSLCISYIYVPSLLLICPRHFTCPQTHFKDVQCLFYPLEYKGHIRNYGFIWQSVCITKQKDLSLGPRMHLREKKTVVMEHAYNVSTGKAEIGRPRGAHWPGTLGFLVNFLTVRVPSF